MGSSTHVIVSQCEALLRLLCDLPYQTQEEWDGKIGIFHIYCFLYAFASSTWFLFDPGLLPSADTSLRTGTGEIGKCKSREAEPHLPSSAPTLTLLNVKLSWCTGTCCAFVDGDCADTGS